jgi:hypothetical protein
MKPSNFKQRIMTLAVILSAATLTAAAEEVSKDYHKEFTPGPNSTLNITNKFGDVVTETWAENRIVVDVKVTVEQGSAEKAQKMLQMITVNFSETGSDFSAETVFDQDFSSSHWGNDNNHFSIDYNIKMPANVNLNIVNKYGNADIDDMTSRITVDLKYGNLYADNLTRGNDKPISEFSVAYGKADIKELNWGKIEARYCGQFNIDKATALAIDSKYSKISLGDVSSVVCESKYDNYNLSNINNFVAVGGYTNFNITSVAKKVDVQTKYGNLIVERIPAAFKSIDVTASYCTVKLGIEPAACYTLKAESRYGGIKLDDSNFDPTTRIIGNTSSVVSGVSGKCKNPESTVNVSTSYGSVTLY